MYNVCDECNKEFEAKDSTDICLDCKMSGISNCAFCDCDRGVCENKFND